MWSAAILRLTIVRVLVLHQMPQPILHDDCMHRPLHVRHSQCQLTASHPVQLISDTHTTAKGCRCCGHALLCNLRRVFYTAACVGLGRASMHGTP